MLTVAIMDAVGEADTVATVDVALLTHEQGSPITFEGRPTPSTGDAGVWLLTTVPPEFDFDGYVLTNQSSLVLASQDGTDVRGGGASQVAGQLEQFSDLDDLMSHLRTSAGW